MASITGFWRIHYGTFKGDIRETILVFIIIISPLNMVCHICLLMAGYVRRNDPVDVDTRNEIMAIKHWIKLR
jgi:hypothetical protein